MYSNSSYAAAQAAASGVMAVYYIICIAISALCIVGMWKVFTKAGEAGWKSIIPIYNGMTLFKIIYGRPAKFFMLLIPVFGEILMIAAYVRLGQVFGKSVGFRLGLVFLSPVFLLILAFDKSEYVGPILEGTL